MSGADVEYQARYRTTAGDWVYSPWSVSSLEGVKKIAGKWLKTAKERKVKRYLIQIIVVKPQDRWGEVVWEARSNNTSNINRRR